MSTVIVYEQTNGQIATVIPTADYLLNQPIEQLVSLTVPAGAKYQITQASDLPDAADFFNAWVFNESKEVVVDMPKAIKIKQQQIREERAAKFTDLDVKFMKALEVYDIVQIAEISAKKQALRDATKDPSIVNATSVEELRVATPSAFAP